MYEDFTINNINGDELCEVCTVAPSSIVLDKCKLVDEANIYVTDCPCQNKILELTIIFSELCPKGDFTKLAVCVKISKPYDPSTPPESFIPFAIESKFVELPTAGVECNTVLEVPFTFCLDECMCSDKKIDVKVCAHYIF